MDIRAMSHVLHNALLALQYKICVVSNFQHISGKFPSYILQISMKILLELRIAEPDCLVPTPC